MGVCTGVHRARARVCVRTNYTRVIHLCKCVSETDGKKHSKGSGFYVHCARRSFESSCVLAVIESILLVYPLAALLAHPAERVPVPMVEEPGQRHPKRKNGWPEKFANLWFNAILAS